MSRLEYLLAVIALRFLWVFFALLPVRRDKVVFASARARELQGNLRYTYDALHAARPDLHYVFLLHRYSYTLSGKLHYMLRLVRGLYHLMTARVFIVDNAYFPVHVVKHHKDTTVVQVWHAAGALKKFGLDVSPPDRRVENGFLHKNYDYVVVGSPAAVTPYATALRTAEERVIPLGTARTDFFFSEDRLASARERVYREFPVLRDKRVVLYAPTFRGHGCNKRPCYNLDTIALRALLPDEYALIRKGHPVIDHLQPDYAGCDAVAGQEFDVNELFTVTDVLITDYSSCIFEYARLGKQLILLVDDLEEYSRDPGLYLDYASEMIGDQARSTAEVGRLIDRDDFDPAEYDEFVATHCGMMDGDSSRRFVDFVSALLPPQRPCSEGS